MEAVKSINPNDTNSDFSPLPCESCNGTGKTDKGWTCYGCGQTGHKRRIRAEYIIIHRAEGFTAECKPKLAYGDREERIDIWEEANAILRKAAQTAPDKGGYDKTDFIVLWQNGEVYRGRFDLQRSHETNADLGQHIFEFQEICAGRTAVPAWVTEDLKGEGGYRDHSSAYQRQQRAQGWLRMLDENKGEKGQSAREFLDQYQIKKFGGQGGA